MRDTEDAIQRAEGRQRLSSALIARFAGVRGRLEALSAAPPQVLLLEGATQDERFALALWWATRLNCTQEHAPCLECSECVHIMEAMHHDLHIFDGREGTISIDAVRSLRGLLGEPPRGEGYRVVIFAEAQALGEAAANALLKSLEEPRPSTVFLLLAPQRERLLPTLVSRSWVLTLPWPSIQLEPSSETAHWLMALASFAKTGRGWFEKTAPRGAVDASGALTIVLACESALIAALTASNTSPLSQMLSTSLSEQGRAAFYEVLAQCSESLSLQPSPVNPALVLDWLATRLYILIRRYPSA